MFKRLSKLHILFLFSLIIRVGYAFFIEEDILVGDAKGYYDNALYLLGWADGVDFKWVSFWSPGESLYLAGWMFFLGTGKWVVVSSMLAVWAAFFYLWDRWASFFLEERTRLLILLLFSIFPTFIHHSVVPLTHLPATTCMVGVFYLLYRKWGAFSAIWLGVVFGFLLLIRPANLLLVFIFPVFIRMRKEMLLTGVSCLLVVGAWSGYLYEKTGSFVFVSESNGYNLYMGNHPETPKYATWWWASHTWKEGSRLKLESDSLLAFAPGQIGQHFQGLAIHYIKEQPMDFVLRTFNRLRCLFAFDTFTGSMLMEHHGKYVAFATIGIDGMIYIWLMILFILSFVLPQKKALFSADLFKVSSYFQLMSCLLISLPYFFSFAHPTYHFSLLPIVAIGAGIFWTNRDIIKRQTITLSNLIVIIWLVFFMAIQIEWIFFRINQ